MNFSDALILLKENKKMRNLGWNGKNMFIFLVPGSEFTVNREPLLSALGNGVKATYRAHIDMKGADGKLGVWMPSICDLLSEQWELCEEDVFI